MLTYAGLDNTYGIELLTKQLKELENESNHSFRNDQLMPLLKLANTRNFKAVKLMVRSLPKEAIVEDMVALLEDIEIQLKQKEALDKKEAEKKQHAQEIENKKQAAKEEQKRITLEQEQQKLQQQEEQKQQAEAEKQLKQQQFATSLRQSFDLFAAQNQLEEEIFEKINSFVDDLQEIAATINKALRPDQLITLGLLILSEKHTTLIQLMTGAGKSLMLGVLAQYLNKSTGKKIIVLVPTSFLHAYQQNNYCPSACKIPEKMADPNSKLVFYSDFNRFTAPDFIVPEDTIILGDEFHEMFFDQQVTIVNGKVVSVISKLIAAVKVIGVSATYRGDAGMDKITSILKDSLFINSPKQFQEKELQLEVFGRVEQQDIIARAVVLAQEKAKTMPVIIFCDNPSALQQQQLPHALIFAGNQVGELNEILKFLRNSSNDIIITTSTDSKGVDFVFALPQAFIIHTVLPKSLVQLKQDSGRGVRGNSLPVLGAVITEKMYFTLEGLELGLTHEQQFEKLYPADYLQSLQHLERLPTATTETQNRVFSEAIAALNSGKSFNDICIILSKSPAFKKALPKSAEFKIPEPLKKIRSALMDAREEEEQCDDRESLLGKRQKQESGKEAKEKDSEKKLFSKSTVQQTLRFVSTGFGQHSAVKPTSSAASISYINESHHTLPNNLSPNSAQKQPQPLPNKEEHITSTELQEGSATVLSSITLDRLNNQASNDISPSDSVSQVGGESQVVESLVANRKRESKAATKSSKTLSEISRSSLGRFEAKYKVGEKTTSGAIIKEIKEENWEFQEKDKKGNSYYKCSSCSKPKILKSDRKKHACKV